MDCKDSVFYVLACIQLVESFGAFSADELSLSEAQQVWNNIPDHMRAEYLRDAAVYNLVGRA